MTSFARKSLTTCLRAAAATAAVTTGPIRRNGVCIQAVREAGHSHWQNIRHIKAEKDMNKSKTTERHVRILITAVNLGGGPDPRHNKMLAHAIETAKRTQVVTNAAIEAAIKRAVEGQVAKTQRLMVYEFIGENGVLALADCEVGQVSKFVHTLKQIIRRHVWAISRGGVKERFERKGFVTVSGKQDGSKFDPDEALAVALDGGAEDMHEVGEGDMIIHEFVSAPDDYHKLMGALQKGGYNIHDAGLKWIPFSTVELSDENISKVSAFCDELEDLPEVISVHTNVA